MLGEKTNWKNSFGILDLVIDIYACFETNETLEISYALQTLCFSQPTTDSVNYCANEDYELLVQPLFLSKDTSFILIGYLIFSRTNCKTKKRTDIKNHCESIWPLKMEHVIDLTTYGNNIQSSWELLKLLPALALKSQSYLIANPRITNAIITLALQNTNQCASTWIKIPLNRCATLNWMNLEFQQNCYQLRVSAPPRTEHRLTYYAPSTCYIVKRVQTIIVPISNHKHKLHEMEGHLIDKTERQKNYQDILCLVSKASFLFKYVNSMDKTS